MNKISKGSPVFGVILGLAFVAFGVLLLTIGFWKSLLLLVLFFLGYFIGSVNNKADVIKETVNRIAPGKTVKPIDLKAELRAEQKEQIEE